MATSTFPHRAPVSPMAPPLAALAAADGSHEPGTASRRLVLTLTLAATLYNLRCAPSLGCRRRRGVSPFSAVTACGRGIGEGVVDQGPHAGVAVEARRSRGAGARRAVSRNSVVLAALSMARVSRLLCSRPHQLPEPLTEATAIPRRRQDKAAHDAKRMEAAGGRRRSGDAIAEADAALKEAGNTDAEHGAPASEPRHPGRRRLDRKRSCDAEPAGFASPPPRTLPASPQSLTSPRISRSRGDKPEDQERLQKLRQLLARSL